MMLNQTGDANKGAKLNKETKTHDAYIISVNGDTDKVFSGTGKVVGSSYDTLSTQGVFLSNTISGQDGVASDQNVIGVDQGLNTTAIEKTFTIDPTLDETQFIVEIDNRLGYITNSGGATKSYSFLDDDNIASYSFSTSDNDMIVNLNAQSDSPINGPRGHKLKFRVAPSIELNSSTYLFTLLGTNENLTFGAASNRPFRRIDSNIRITGATTGYRLNIPIVFLRDNPA